MATWAAVVVRFVRSAGYAQPDFPLARHTPPGPEIPGKRLHSDHRPESQGFGAMSPRGRGPVRAAGGGAPRPPGEIGIPPVRDPAARTRLVGPGWNAQTPLSRYSPQ